MKKKKITYADQAKLILKKYEKRLGKNFTNNDKLAKDALDRELTELKNKQEAFKAQEQQVQIETMMRKGGRLPIYKEPNKNNNYGNLPKEDDYGLMNDGYIDRFDANTLVQGVPIKRPTDFEGNEVDVGYTPLDLSQFDISPEQEAALMAGKEAENLKFALNANNFKLPTNIIIIPKLKFDLSVLTPIVKVLFGIIALTIILILGNRSVLKFSWMHRFHQNSMPLPV